jgi:hypothetical protein
MTIMPKCFSVRSWPTVQYPNPRTIDTGWRSAHRRVRESSILHFTHFPADHFGQLGWGKNLRLKLMSRWMVFWSTSSACARVEQLGSDPLRMRAWIS